MADSIEDILDQVASDPEHVAVDGMSVTSRPIPDLIKLADRKAIVDAARQSGNPLSFSQFEPGRCG
jgi:hypothetical protein